jgi:hypothetical protein
MYPCGFWGETGNGFLYWPIEHGSVRAMTTVIGWWDDICQHDYKPLSTEAFCAKLQETGH